MSKEEEVVGSDEERRLNGQAKELLCEEYHGGDLNVAIWTEGQEAETRLGPGVRINASIGDHWGCDAGPARSALLTWNPSSSSSRQTPLPDLHPLRCCLFVPFESTPLLFARGKWPEPRYPAPSPSTGALGLNGPPSSPVQLSPSRPTQL